ncbi:hypothetical protein PC116_g21440 [Phytophthora cactorum]|nr:hypothetical protein PC116_g21440 [Phytophthora cactorum]
MPRQRNQSNVAPKKKKAILLYLYRQGGERGAAPWRQGICESCLLVPSRHCYSCVEQESDS